MTTEPPHLREYPVHARLAPFVKCIWSLESNKPFCDVPRERILPDSCVELVFHFYDSFRTHFADGRTAIQPRSFVVGQMKRFLEIEPAGRIGFIAVRFFARGAYLFFHRPLSEVAAGVVDLEELWGKEARHWSERIALAGAMPERVRLVERVLLGTLKDKGHQNLVVDRGLQLIEASGGQLRVGQLAAELGVSSRQLTRHFQDSIGLTPKEFARVSRFLRAVRILGVAKYASLTEAALECGYFDQAHFNHEFREFAGMSPGELATFPNVAF